MIFHALHQLEDTTSWAYPEGRRLLGFRPGETEKTGVKDRAKR